MHWRYSWVEVFVCVNTRSSVTWRCIENLFWVRRYINLFQQSCKSLCSLHLFVCQVGDSYLRLLGSKLCLCDAFWLLINSPFCWFEISWWVWTLHYLSMNLNTTLSVHEFELCVVCPWVWTTHSIWKKLQSSHKGQFCWGHFLSMCHLHGRCTHSKTVQVL